MGDKARTLLSIRDLRISIDTSDGEVQAVRGISLDIEEGETFVIVGESGCGKSVTAQTIMKLNPMPPTRIKSGEIELDGIDIANANERTMQEVRGSLVGMVFQDPMTSLNPTLTVGRQIGETLEIHKGMKRRGGLKVAADLLEAVRIPGASKRVKQYPSAFSGGMRQRALIAAAIACKPKLLIADEPTTALDVTIQAQILDLLRSIQQTNGTAILLITHDLGVAARMAKRMAVMYAGKIVETGTARQLFHDSKHPYTRGLLNSVPRPEQDRDTELQTIGGSPPKLINPPVGCGFAARCPHAMRICREIEPMEQEVESGHRCSCWLLHPSAPKVERQPEEEAAHVG